MDVELWEVPIWCLVLMKKALQLEERIQEGAVAEVAAVEVWGQEYRVERLRSIYAML